ncbi:izumo sperm-egg fusion protein 1 isoform X1 [Alligator sinensis]|uniref:Izumo sperm-egg fusion protein 1 isoform X1 n=1 Tax=Alligator sinensis TaxID=38654 RepID=A0A3Q0GVU8_ALLSI|nr:izumo sperm-egg fusion protein 1 isoform X1 [Alligator sinensis]
MTTPGPCPQGRTNFCLLLTLSFFAVYCLNKCGQLLQLLTDCKTCKTDIHTCSKDVHCGDRKLEVEEDEDLILDCALTWHHVSYGIKNYIFYRVWGHTEQHIVSGPDPFLVRKEVTVNDSGSYRCEMRDAKNMLCSQMQFQVTGEGGPDSCD